MSKQIVKKISSFYCVSFFSLILLPSSLYTCTSPCISADTFFVVDDAFNKRVFYSFWSCFFEMVVFWGLADWSVGEFLVFILLSEV